MDTALNPTAKNELQETVERMEEKWHIFHPHPSNQYLVWCFKWERNYFDIGSTAYFCCHGVLPVVRAAVDRVNVFICINTVFLLMPVVNGGLHLKCDTWVERKQGGISYIEQQRRRVWFSFMPFSKELLTQRANCFSSLSPPLLSSTVQEISLWFTVRGMYFLWPVDSLITPCF